VRDVGHAGLSLATTTAVLVILLACPRCRSPQTARAAPPGVRPGTTASIVTEARCRMVPASRRVHSFPEAATAHRGRASTAAPPFLTARHRAVRRRGGERAVRRSADPAVDVSVARMRDHLLAGRLLVLLLLRSVLLFFGQPFRLRRRRTIVCMHGRRCSRIDGTRMQRRPLRRRWDERYILLRE
jgi:hypothetical protein